MRVLPLTSVLSHKGRGCRCSKPFYTVSLEVKELIKHPLSGFSSVAGTKETGIKLSALKIEGRSIGGQVQRAGPEDRICGEVVMVRLSW